MPVADKRGAVANQEKSFTGNHCATGWELRIKQGLKVRKGGGEEILKGGQGRGQFLGNSAADRDIESGEGLKWAALGDPRKGGSHQGRKSCCRRLHKL